MRDVIIDTFIVEATQIDVSVIVFLRVCWRKQRFNVAVKYFSSGLALPNH